MSTLIRFIQFVLVFAWVMPAGAESAAPRTIVVLGDSLSAGYGLKIQEGWVNLLAQRLASEGYGYKVVNASVSGETTQGGLSRLPRALELHKPDIVIIELGGNDGLRGLPLATSRENLRRSIELARAARARVLLVGMMIPPNYGQRYGQEFRDMFTTLATTYSLALVPFLLDRVALEPGLMQPDGIHANAKGQPRMLENVWPKLKPLLVAPRKPAS
ncbi:MAG TPA: arylesterase [Steroidobacteraceae bacterium]|nr:arylesterase [Steroidobacteraceae bacterium]